MKFGALYIYPHVINIYLHHGIIMSEFGMVFVFLTLNFDFLAYFKKGQRKVVKTIAAKFVAEEEEVDAYFVEKSDDLYIIRLLFPIAMSTHCSYQRY